MKRALVSVSDKTNLVSFVQNLVELGYEIISTGGTKKTLEEAGMNVIAIDEVTGFPEILEGRVKTLHPMVHGGLLAKRDDAHHQEQVTQNNIKYIDLVCVNLYPFAKTIQNPEATHEDKIENIDIGGPSMLRSAAKNFNDVTVVVDANDYDLIISEIREQGNTTLKTRQMLAGKVFNHTAAYDAMIANYFNEINEVEVPEKLTVTYDLKQTLRYGENPHQKAAFYQTLQQPSYSVVSSEQLHGKELSYNNISDANAALEILQEFEGAAAVAVKHMNPCGVGLGTTIEEAYAKAYEADPTSIFGGIVALNREVSKPLAEELHKIFLEIVIAPSFTEEALEVLKQKKNIRLLTTDMSQRLQPGQKLVSVKGGLLVQELDTVQVKKEDLECVTEVKPTEEDLEQLLFGFQVCKHVKSNAITLVKNDMTIGVGAGQMNRVGSAKIALEQAGALAQGAYLASDAFFPMSDTVELAAKYGIKAIIQPGGSIKDQDSIDACNKHGIAMVFTKVRHFKH
ncbi:bifunctional phosphoribosylaminoimidazolecarboxamide formyltransferase/IMP cyclohydrolase [Turicibacter bilis]|uniref:bifunctional phosphoribosylaminoimidazolecarboxamide formyltransferase/IMP cyclohydrolase n=1 Tax=Turicibacter bilis TaxID=2735723 RepID=UPI001BB0AF83|nr:bifunctional phosphoribosylaminoimidazolecarboxamide formyltransferase/IMP cyclohydrolase [Turicibacter bilis]MBS3203172.1 bifunctional phosphoribosylaminoimidazolecarboxamide formyltransferase/IMP cyclohydrolase [Turicibacter bilis]MDY4814384.1 bifunctional phosphoribosylaminoimidazolecarboxamide formyltransferase/IMP cyclohydrolase [Turicibacter bilis]UUF11456.1 bifunctional phosphoribosylaminoimidazolecarboxamide formyltransferase/IMP cyclohydrolase [Turicibacter bilis]